LQPDHLDLDSDNDGLTDIIESGGGDTNSDGMVDGFTDVNNDGLHDGSAGTEGPDFDGDMVLDSDNDGLPDSIEGGATGVDSDGDGIDDAFDVDAITGGVDLWR